MPCASVLVLELLRLAHHPDEQSIPNRSGVIQDISVLISCCDTLAEMDMNNYQICKQAQSIFSRSLDSILDPTKPFQKTENENMAARQHEQMDAANMDLAMAHDSEWTAWLESVGLQPDPWLDSIMQTLEFPVTGNVQRLNDQ